MHIELSTEAGRSLGEQLRVHFNLKFSKFEMDVTDF